MIWNMEQSQTSGMEVKKKLRLSCDGGKTGEGGFPSLQSLCRKVIIEEVGLKRAREETPLPATVVSYLVSGFTLKDFEISSKKISREHKVHGIYAAKCVSDGSPVTLKFINLNFGHGGDTEQTIREWAEVNHSNITSCLGWFKTKGAIVLVFEHTSKNLQDLIRACRKDKKQLSEWLIWKIISQLSSAFHHLHAKDIVHSDIQTRHISLTKSGNVKLDNLLLYTPSELDMNVCLNVKDSFYGIYVAPERIRGLKHSCKQDVWALGCLFYEMINLVPAYRIKTGTGIFDVLNEIVEGKMPSMVASCYSQDLTNLVKSCLNPESNLRPLVGDILSTANKKVELLQPRCKVNFQVPKSPVVLG